MRFGRWALLAGVVSLLAPAPAPALEAFEGRIQLHGAISEDLRVLSNGYRVRDHNWFMSKMATKLSLEFEFELFPDGIGPLDIVEAFARVDVQYDCIYNHACHMAPQWNYFGDDARRAPEHLADGRAPATTGVVLNPLETRGRIQPDNRLVTLIDIPPFSTLLALGNPTAIANTFDDLFDAKFSTNYQKGSIEPLIFGIGPLNPDFFIDSTGYLAANDVDTGSNQPFRAQAPSLFVPTRALLKREGQFDNPDVNFTENELAWNRGASQQQTKELKEAYLDITMLDGQLQLRLGKQITRWGKTELFRGGSPDQFNPQDFAISNLPSFEESLIALWQARGIFSFYDVGPFEDLRLEIAVNLDHFEPSDFGDCGEPYTLWLVCGKQLGLLGHGFSGIGVAGEVRPQNWFDSSSGLEFGARLEFRIGGFSVAITDFYGYDDFPTADFFYEYHRNVDPLTGRPRVVGSTGYGSCVTGAEVSCQQASTANADVTGNRTLFDTSCSATLGFELGGGFGAVLGNIFDDTCAISLFSSGAAIPLPGNPPVPLLFSATTGEGDFWNADGLCLIVCPLLGRPATFGPYPGPPYNGTNPNAAQRTALFNALGTVPLHYGGATDYAGALPVGAIIANPTGGLSVFLSDEQEALLGCGPFYGQGVDACHNVGVDLFNAEGSVLFQRFPQFEGGGFPLNAPVATRAVEGVGLVNLPGARSPFAIDFSQPQQFWYDPAVDGCVLDLNDPIFTQTYGFDITTRVNNAALCNGVTGVPRPNGVAPANRATLDANGGFYTPEQIRRYFPTELAIVSENLLRLLGGIQLTIDQSAGVDVGCLDFNGTDLFLPEESFLACDLLNAFFNTLGARRPELRAGGNGRFGRRDFAWHSGSEIALFYERRNVLGVGVDFTEDRTKTSWGVEFTWVEDAPYQNARADRGFSREDTLNLTISLDRPTFINFLNANRTVFFNAQFFLRYIPNYERRDTFAVDGPAAMLATLTAFTGFYQDRLMTFLTLVHEVESNSGGQIWTVSYRITEAFSVTVGLSNFFGQPRRLRVPDRPAVARFHGADYTARQNYQGVSPLAERDEIFFNIRHTF